MRGTTSPLPERLLRAADKESCINPNVATKQYPATLPALLPLVANTMQRSWFNTSVIAAGTNRDVHQANDGSETDVKLRKQYGCSSFLYNGLKAQTWRK